MVAKVMSGATEPEGNDRYGAARSSPPFAARKILQHIEDHSVEDATINCG
jgi:hypothetical protein